MNLGVGLDLHALDVDDLSKNAQGVANDHFLEFVKRDRVLTFWKN